jgi:acyl-CoA synthetase (AMP-forming)/AMP-acid ligase II
VIDAPDLWSLVEARANATPDAVFAIDEHWESLTFAEYRERALRVAAALHARGIREGDLVSWQLPSWIAACVLSAALARLGAVQNPVLALLREREVGFIVRQAKPKLWIAPSRWRDFDYAAMARSVLAGTGCDYLACNRALPEADPAQLPPYTVPRGEPIRWLLYTSGTTADPKGVLHSDASMAAGARGMGISLELEAGDRWAIVFPITHVGGVGMLYALMQFGTSVALVESFDASTPRLLGRLGVTVASGGTALALRYLDAQRSNPREPVFPALRVTLCGASPKPIGLHEQIRDELGGSGIVSVYGLTEAPFTTASGIRDTADQLTRTEGRAIEGCELRIVDAEGRVCPPGESGEVRIRGTHLFKGYLDDSLNAEAFDSTGFFRSGDLGCLDADGCLEITGRLKDVIIRNGENISAKQIEDLLFAHPDVKEAAVIGLPDPRTGERACAVIVPKDAARTVTLETIARHCREAGLPIQKVPEQVENVDELPRNATGKVLKYELRARYAKKSKN